MSRQMEETELSDLIPLGEACKLLPGRPHRSTVFRWAQKGREGVRLKVVSVGKTRCTTERWLMEFFEAVQKARTEQEPIPDGRVNRKWGKKKRRRPREGQMKLQTQDVLRRHKLTKEN